MCNLVKMFLVAVILFVMYPVAGSAGEIEGEIEIDAVKKTVSAKTDLTLDDCLELGLKANLTIMSADLMVDAANEDIKAALADRLPSLTSSLAATSINSINSSGPSDSDYLDQENVTFRVGLSQPIYMGNRLVNAQSKAMLRKEMFQADKAYTQREVLYNIKGTFFQLMKAAQDVKIAVDTVARLEADLTIANAFFDKQMAPYAQVLQAKVDLADARQTLSRTENEVERKRSELFVLINQDYSHNSLPGDNPNSEKYSNNIRFQGGLDHYARGFTTTVADCLKKALELRPDLQSLARQKQMAQKDADMALGRYHPRVTLDAGYYDQDKDYKEVDYDQRNRYWTAGVNLSWDFFDGGRGWFEKNRARIEMARIDRQVQHLKQRLEAGIITTLFSLSEAEDRILATLDAKGAAAEYYQREHKRFLAGIATIASVLDAQVRVTRADSNYNQALLDYQLARAELDFMTGVI